MCLCVDVGVCGCVCVSVCDISCFFLVSAGHQYLSLVSGPNLCDKYTDTETDTHNVTDKNTETDTDTDTDTDNSLPLILNVSPPPSAVLCVVRVCRSHTPPAPCCPAPTPR